jgi:hypothetical protein
MHNARDFPAADLYPIFFSTRESTPTSDLDLVEKPARIAARRAPAQDDSGIIAQMGADPHHRQRA